MALWQPVDPNTYISEFSAPLPHPAEVFASPGYTQPPPVKNPLATAAVVLGILAIMVPVLALGAILCGHIAARDKARGGAHLVRGGLGLGYTVVGVWALVILSLVVSANF